MDNTLYVGLSQQMLLRHELDIVANNMANADTTGFKLESILSATNPKAPARTLGGPQPVTFVVDRGVARDFNQGGLRQTDAPLDLGIEGQGFFKVSTPDGERYTRDGRFRLDATGKITTQSNHPVLDEGGGEIQIDPLLGAITIAADGTVSQGGDRVGKIGVVNFDSLGVLDKAGDSLFRNTSNLQSQPAPDARVRQGMLEGSNVRPIIEITRLIELSRAYEQTTKLMDSTSDLTRRTIERLGRMN